MTTGRVKIIIIGILFVLVGWTFGQSVEVRDFYTCEDVIVGNPQNRASSFGDDVEKLAIYMRLAQVYESLEITWEWTNLTGEGRLLQTQKVPSPVEQGYDFWEEYICWGILDLSEISPDKKSGRWEIKATANGIVLGISEFTVLESSQKELDTILLANEGAIENVEFNYPSDWYFYDDELTEGFCQVWFVDNEGSFVSFSIYLTSDQLLDAPSLNENLIKRETTTLSGMNADWSLVNIFDEVDSVWYKSSIYQLLDFRSLHGGNIFLVSYAPVEKYEKYANIFSDIFESVRIILF